MNNKFFRFLITWSWLYPLLILLGIFVFGIYLGNSKRDILPTAAYIANTISEESLESEESSENIVSSISDINIKENGNYTSKADVALYIHTYNKLPNNYISKKDASAAGWNQETDNLDIILPGRSIGGDEYGNSSDKLPKAEGRRYYEADIDYDGGSRNSKRIVYSSDGLIFYTEDSYENFERLY